MRPYMGHGVRSNCTRVCPKRQGATSGWVVDELVAGRIMDGLHPNSFLILQARLQLSMKDNAHEAEKASLRREIQELEGRVQDLEEHQQQIMDIQDRLAHYDEGVLNENNQGSSSQPGTEPAQ